MTTKELIAWMDAEILELRMACAEWRGRIVAYQSILAKLEESETNNG